VKITFRIKLNRGGKPKWIPILIPKIRGARKRRNGNLAKGFIVFNRFLFIASIKKQYSNVKNKNI
jgi:hypothetical protein